jgi:hypothetical protein
MGIEYRAHTWELGPRKAKEMLFSQDSVSAQEALRTDPWAVAMRIASRARIQLGCKTCRYDGLAVRCPSRRPVSPLG